LDQELGNVEGKRQVKFKSISQGTATHVYASFDPEIASHNGAHLLDCRLAKPEEIRSKANDPEQAERLWRLSEQIVGQDF
jgi:hypothetical protein